MKIIGEMIGHTVNGMLPNNLPCPHCNQRPFSLDMHLRFDCPVIRPKVPAKP